jgi:hypothetical protein
MAAPVTYEPEGRLERLVYGIATKAERVQHPLFWRALYALLGSRPATAALGLFLRGGGDDRLERLLDVLSRSGWPHHEPGWRNLHANRFLMHAYQRSKGGAPRRRRARAAVDGPLRTGVVGSFARMLGFSSSFFAAAPDDFQLAFFDLPTRDGTTAGYLADVGEYAAFDVTPENRRGTLGGLTRAMSEAGLDLLLVLGETPLYYDILDGADARCIAFVGSGMNLLYHPAVDFHLNAQREADYFVQEHRMFSGTTGRPLCGDRVFPAWMFYDTRGIDPAACTPVSDRDPLIVFHGSLYKAYSPRWLSAIFTLMQEDGALELVLMGPDFNRRSLGGPLDAIRRAAAAAGVAGRVHYDGAYAPTRGPSGAIEDPGWHRLQAHLARARLAPNPFPVGGGSSRVEAYLSGVPVPHMGVRTDPESWGRPQSGSGEIPALRVDAATAFSVNEYVAVARLALYDDAFAEEIVDAQLRVARKVTSPEAYWRQVRTCYESWAAGIR